jgi:hypothetical protein
VAIEDAGFDIRDQIMWVYGSGFPKSHNISKAIDKNGGGSLRWFVDYIESVCEERGIPTKEITALFPSKNGNMTGWFWNKKSGTQDLTPQQFNAIRDFLSLPYGDISHAEREIVGYKESGLGSGSTYAFSGQNNEATKNIPITAPATAKAKEWDGWGTALKPAHEPIVMARKPLDGTVANNVLKYGVGGINIDGCRVGRADGDDSSAGNQTATFGTQDTLSGGDGSGGWSQNEQGRFPANFIHDGSDEVTDLLGDSGSAARFFYCAKASKAERNAGLEGFEAKKMGRNQSSLDGGQMLTGSGNIRNNSKLNHHPTVKPIALMRYLVRLVTPPNGTVLDPFAGSGTTLVAATIEKFDCIGIEMTDEYLPIIGARVAHAKTDTLF